MVGNDEHAVPVLGSNRRHETDNDDFVLNEEDLMVRKKIVEILDKIETKFAYSDKLLQNELTPFKQEDRNLGMEIVNGALRWRERLDWYIAQLYNGKFEDLILTVKNILRSALYQLIFLDKVPSYAILNESVEIAKQKFNQKTANLVNAILRNYIRQEKKLQWMETQMDVLDKISIRLSHPRWLVQRWIEFWGIDQVELLCQKNNERPPMFVRMNTLKTTMKQFEDLMENKGVRFEKDDRLPYFYRIDNFSVFKQEKFLEYGYAIMQDMSAALPVMLLKPDKGQRVWDMCAAPGGKTAHLGIVADGLLTLIASDLYANRVKLIKRTSSNVGLRGVSVIAGDALQLSFKEKFDKILLDAPCSGFGTLRRRTDLRWKKTEKNIMELGDIQSRLLEKAADSVRSGGEIVYSTCTMDLYENDRTVENFLNGHPEFSVVNARERVPGPWVDEKGYIRTFPHLHDMDGSFAVLLRKS